MYTITITNVISKPDFTPVLLTAPECDTPQRPLERSYAEYRTGISPRRVGDATSSYSINVNPDLGLTLCLVTSVIPNQGPSTIFCTATNCRNNGCPIKSIIRRPGSLFPTMFQFPNQLAFLFHLWEELNRQPCDLYSWYAIG